MTFLFTDIEGSTRLLHELGEADYADALAEHRRIMRAAFARHGGAEVDTQGDAFFAAFPTAQGALDAAHQAIKALADGPIRVRIGIHTGTPLLTAEGYVGPDVHRAARIAAAGHGGQVLVSSTTAALLSTNALRDLGEHRLKDLSAPERISQLGEAEFPPLKSLHQSNLPVPATAFLGREEEVAEVAELVRRLDVRAVTLTGPGGTGKTRLALQAAGSLGDAFEGGVWWVPLAPIRDPQLVLAEAARALGVQGDVADHVGDKQMLILFDNFEQVTSAAAHVARLLERCPRLKILVTSREPLRIAGEWEYAVEPLREPEAVELFMTRAVAARRHFVADGEVRLICQRLDNLPLAIELAAARVKILSPKALLERLERRLPVLSDGTRDAPERQRTLRATIEWSHELLSEDEQRLFARLSVFRGGWTLRAAEMVAEAELDTLQSLIDKSLVRQPDDRFGMLETIREYAAERLEASGQAAEILRRHAEFFLELAEEAEPHLRRGDRRLWLDRIGQDHDNFRAAIEHFTAVGETQRGLRLGASLLPFWDIRSYWAEGRRRVETLLNLDAASTPARAHALAAASKMATFSGDAAAGLAWADEGVAVASQLGDAWSLANAVFSRAYAVSHEDEAAGRGLFEEAMRRFAELGDEHASVHAAYNLAVSLEEAGELERARALLEHNLERARALGDERAESMALGALAGLAPETATAVAMLVRSAEIERDLGDPTWLSINLLRLARRLLSAGHTHAASSVLATADAVMAERGLPLPPWSEETRAAIVAELDADVLEGMRPAAPDPTVEGAFAVARKAVGLDAAR